MRRRFGPDVLLAVVLPVVAALALLLLHPDRGEPHGKAPVDTQLTSASVVCPTALPGTGSDLLGVSVLGADPEAKVTGDVQVGLGSSVAPLPVRSRQVSTAAQGLGPTVVTGSDDLAPGLVAGRSQSAPLAAVDCAPPVADQWFTGVGADATHDSVVELVNPNAGSAIADITVRAPSGVLDVPALPDVSVPGNSSVQLDLGQIVPNRAELSLEVHTSRGRLAVHVVDSYDELGSGATGQDWLPAQAEPASANLLLGLTQGAGERTLVLSNPGVDEVRAEITVVTPTSTFAPVGVEPVRVAPDIHRGSVPGRRAGPGGQGRRHRAARRVQRPCHRYPAAVRGRRSLRAHRARPPSPRPPRWSSRRAEAPAARRRRSGRRRDRDVVLGAREAAGPAARSSSTPDAGADVALPGRRGPRDADPDGDLGAGRGAAQRHRHRRRAAAGAGADRAGARRATRAVP